MYHVLRGLYDILGPEHIIGKLVGIAVTIVGAVFVFRELYPSLHRLFLLRLRRWRIRPLDDVARRLLAGEQAYLSRFLDVVQSRKWDPKRFVVPDLNVNQKVLEPIDPILVLLDHVSGLESPDKANRSEFRERTKTSRFKDLLTLVREVRSIVIIGDPGSGKTTCLLQLGVELANRADLSGTLYPVLPVYLPLNEFTEELPSTKVSDAVFNFVKQQVRQQAAGLDGADISNRLDTFIRDGRIAFLFDALDEMPRDGYYDRFRALSRFVKSCSTQNDKNLFVFTCRRLDYVDDPTFPVQQAILSPLSDRQVHEFFKRYLPRTGNATYNDFMTKHESLAFQARSPFFLSLLTTCVRAGVEPGGTWNVLIANFVQVVLEGYRKGHGFDRAEWEEIGLELSTWLSDFAFELVRSRATGTKADLEMIEQSLDRVGASQDNVDIACECGILRKVGSEGAVRFEHHRLQEYFASLRLAALFDEGQTDVYEYLDDIWWREVIFMAAGIMNHPDQLVDQILDAAADLQFAQYSEVSLEFTRVMTAMNCYRSASHKLTSNTQERLTEYLIQFLRHGNILQKVKALRVVPQFHNTRVVREARSLLHDRSRWVRETALMALAESATLTGGLGTTIRHQMFQMLKAENLFVRGLQDFPGLFRHKKTRIFLPMYLGCMALGGIRVAAVWLLSLVLLGTLCVKHVFGWSDAAIFAAALPLTYLIARRLLRRRVIGGYRLNMADSFNRWSFMIVAWGLTVQLVSRWLGAIGESVGSVGNIGLGLVSLIFWSAYIYIFSGNILKLYVTMRDRRRKRRVDPSTIVPEKTLRGRCQQAMTLLGAAREDQDPTMREHLIEAIKTLLPLDRSILVALDEYSEGELDINVREKAFQVFEQIEISIEREQGGKGWSSNAEAS